VGRHPQRGDGRWLRPAALAGRLHAAWLAAGLQQAAGIQPNGRLLAVRNQHADSDYLGISAGIEPNFIPRLGVKATFTTIVCLYLCICTSRDITPQCLKCSALPNIIVMPYLYVYYLWAYCMWNRERCASRRGVW
jgi:hypothetical protein